MLLKSLTIASFLFSAPVFANTYKCEVGVSWAKDKTGETIEVKTLGSMLVDTTKEAGTTFSIENSKLSFLCGGQAGGKKLGLTPEPADEFEFYCALVSGSLDSSIPPTMISLASTKFGAPLLLMVSVADESLPMKSKNLMLGCNQN